MRRFSPALSNIGSIALIALPIALAAIVNQTLRPYLAALLGGTAHSGAGWSRGEYVTANQWWEFDAQTRLDHPFVTGYLAQSDGVYLAIGGALSAVVAGIVLYRAAKGKAAPR